MKQQFHTWFSTKNSFLMELFLLFKPKLQGFIWVGLCLLLAQTANAQVSGTVFRDFNSNGTMDNTVTYNEIGLAGVTATAYDAAGTSVGSDISASDGTYTIAGVSGQVRVEFTGLPIGDYSSFSGGTSVQFVTAPVTGVNFAVNYPADYSQPNPTIATVIQRYGGINLDITNGKKTVYSTNYNNQFTTVPHLAPSENGTVNQTGSIWGLAYQRETKKMFISSLVKRHSDLLNDANGNEMTGNVFMTDYSGGTPSSTSLFVDVNTIGINTGTFSRSDLVWPTYPDDQFGDWICDALAINKVGKMGIGDIDISEDGADLFITNLYDRKLYKIYIGNPATTPTAANVTAYSTAPWLTNPSYTCTNGVARPFGVKYYRGKVYVGVVCTAENNGAINDLNARVFELNPATGTWTASPLITVPLNYTKGAVYEPSPGNKLGTNWNPWKDQVQTIMINPSDPSTLTSIYPQPILSDIEFDINGTMVLGFMDRNGHLTGGEGVRAPSSYPPPSGTACIADPAFSYGPYTNAMAGGDILRVGYNAATGSYTLENNATANGITTGGANNNEGPGGGEYYFEDAYNGDPSSNHKDVVQGGLATLYGYDQMLTTTFDPLNIYFSGGIQWYKNSTGEFNAGFQIYDTNNDPTSFGKANGIGDIEILSNPAPLEIGNRVWLDADADGIQDANENPIAGVTIELYAANGTTLLGTATTAADGTWYFNNTNVSGGLMPNTAYIIKVGAADWSGGAGIAQLSGYLLTSANTDGSTNGDARDSDAALLSAIPTISYTTGNYGQNDHTLDMGFKVACNLSATADGSAVACNGGNDGKATATATGNIVPVTYLWSNGETTPSLTGLVAGTYTVTVTEAPTCTAVASYTVTEPLTMDVACSKTDATTIGGAEGTASVIATGGTAPYTYLWSNGETTASITGLTAGTYTVTVTDLNGCTANCMVTVQEPSCNLSANATGTDVSCNGGNNGTAAATASGNLVPVTYLWSNGETTESITGLVAGTYTVTVTEAPTCTAVASYTVTEPLAMDAACSKTDATTIGGAEGTATVNATGGTAPYTYLWSNGETTASITGLTAGTYSVTVTDLNGCTANCMVTVQEPSCNLSATATGTDVSCNGGNNGTATATALGNLVPVTYLWSNGETTASISGLTAGTYTVTVTEAPTCTAVASYTVTEPLAMDAACSKTDATTIGGAEGTASVIATGGTAPYTYLWSNGETTASITGLTAGTYSVTVTDLNGCTANCMVTVQEPGCNLSTNATGTNVSCNAGNNGTATAIASGNLVPVTYLWSNGETTASISGLTAGTYTVTVTEAPTCTAVASYTVTEPLAMDAACSKTDATTIGGAEGTASVIATGGTAPYTYLWSNGETTASISGLTAGTYTITVTDLNGCIANCMVTVQEPGCNLSATADGSAVACNGGNDGKATATVTGNLVPVTYLWSNGETTASITGLTTGTYTVTVTETPSCTAVASYTVTEPALLDAVCSKTDATTIGGADGTASVIATGGTAPYTYLWSNGETTASISGLTAGTYGVTVTDLNGCTANCSVTVQEPGCNLSATADGSAVACNGGNDGKATATVTGNLVPVTYLWSNGETTASITGLTTGTYTVTVTETPTCTAVAAYTVTEPAVLDAACSKTDATTIGGSEGSATVNATGGTAPYTYLWSNGETTASITGLTAGTYTVTVTDANGCTANCSVTVQEPNALPDLSLVKTVNSSIATIGSTVTFTITVSNDNGVDATGVVVTDYMPTGLSFVSSSDPANVTNNNGTITWNIGNFLGADAPKVLTITATVNAAANNATTGEGVHINKAEITAMNEIDIDSTPNNDVAGEDDIDEVCLSVPIDLCNFPTSGITITSGAGQTSYQWYYSTDGISYTIMTGETNQTLNVTVQTIGNLQTGATQMYFKAAYNGNDITGGCGNTMCCPIIISIVNCCQPNKCINIGIVKH